MKKVRIFVEGKEDEAFVQAFLERFFSDTDLPEQEVLRLRGYGNLPKFSNQFKENTDAGGKNIVLIDADDEATQGKAGFAASCTYLEQVREKYHLSFSYFVFPNHSDEGTLENVLEHMINPDHKALFDCFGRYEDCIRGQIDEANGQAYKLPLSKSKFYAYLDAFVKTQEQEKAFKRGERLFSVEEYWNWESDYLDRLRSFFEKELLADIR